MRGVVGEHIGAHHQKTDRAGLALATGGPLIDGKIVGHPVFQLRMIKPDIGIDRRIGGLDDGAQHFARTLGVARDQEPDQVGDVVVGPGQHVLHGQEIGAHILRLAGNEAQQLGDLPQHLHLARTRRTGLRLLAAQALQEPEHAAGRVGHVELAQLRQLDDFGRRQRAHGHIVGLARLFQPGLDDLDMVFEKNHVGDHDVGGGNVLARPRHRILVARPFGHRMQAQRQARKLPKQDRPRALDGRSHVAVEGDDGDPDRCRRR